jgi:hypothetical protein
MKKFLIGLVAWPLLAGVAFATEPLTSQQMDRVTASGLPSVFGTTVDAGSLGDLGFGGIPDVGFGGVSVRLPTPRSGCGGLATCLPAIHSPL